MKTVSGAFQTEMEKTNTTMVWLLTIRLRDDSGDIFRFTTDNQDFVGASATWLSFPGFQMSSIRTSSGSNAAVVEVTIACNDDTPITKADIVGDRLRRAAVRIQVGHTANPTAEPLTVFRGYVNDYQYANHQIVALECGTRWREARTLPVGTFGPKCRWLLGDARCGVDLTEGGDYNKLAVVTSVANRRRFTVAMAAGAGATFAGGALKWVSGPNEGDMHDIRSADGSEIRMWLPAAYDISVGDTLYIHYGCDKTTGPNGCGGFDNIPNFGGFPFLPDEDFDFGTTFVPVDETPP
jgi:uncharacterized phage protein (TIGR02218 family)